MRATSFQREWSPVQYKFEERAVDPTEILHVPIAERARQLGAPLPKD